MISCGVERCRNGRYKEVYYWKCPKCNVNVREGKKQCNCGCTFQEALMLEGGLPSDGSPLNCHGIVIF